MTDPWCLFNEGDADLTLCGCGSSRDDEAELAAALLVVTGGQLLHGAALLRLLEAHMAARERYYLTSSVLPLPFESAWAQLDRHGTDALFIHMMGISHLEPLKVSWVARLAQNEVDQHVGIMQRILTLKTTLVFDYLKQHKARTKLKKLQMLLIMDGCDYLLRQDARPDRFRAFLSDLLTNNACLKIVLTARTSIATDGAVHGYGERLYTLSRFDMESATKMLVSLVGRPIRMDELKHARVPIV
ncbi:hypothetical protein PsorP6_019367 [Peronosclerospora sorghi]|nr:hypothetical protein PsorP6_019367 [Peronosclerospora sorghi]